MISVPITKYFTGGTGPWEYTFYDNNSQGCVSFSNNNDVSDQYGRVDTVATFTTEACLEAADIRVLVRSQDGCVNTFSVDIPNPCDTFAVAGISSEGFQFSVSATPLSGSYEYTWYYDPQVFKLADPHADTNQPFITLELVHANSIPESTPISVTVENVNGCKRNLVLNYIFNRPSAQNMAAILACDRDGSRQNNSVHLNVTSVNPIDWNTLSFGITAANISINHPYSTNPLVAENWIQISAPASEPSGVYTITYTVRDIYGVPSYPATITITVPDCIVQHAALFILDKSFQITESGVIPGDMINIPIFNEVIPNNDVDWTSLKFVDTDTDQMATVVGEANGYDDVTTPNVTYVPVSKEIIYEVPDTGKGLCDCFQWYIKDSNGNVSNAPLYCLHLYYQQAPTANDDSDIVVCGGSTTIDLLANDLANDGIIDPASIVITEQPTVGTLVLPGDGTVIYYAPRYHTGTVTFKYTVSNNNGGSSGQTETSAEATVTIEIICGGEDASIVACQ